jgi:transposase
MSLKRRRFSREFKLQIIAEVESGKSIAQVAREHQIHPITIGNWRKEFTEYGGEAFAGNGNTYKLESRIAELERMIGQLTMENAFLKKALGTFEQLKANSGKNTPTR